MAPFFRPATFILAAGDGVFRFTRLQRDRRGLPEEAIQSSQVCNKLPSIVVPSRKAANSATSGLFKRG